MNSRSKTPRALQGQDVYVLFMPFYADLGQRIPGDDRREGAILGLRDGHGGLRRVRKLQKPGNEEIWSTHVPSSNVPMGILR